MTARVRRSCAMVKEDRYPILRRLIPTLPQTFSEWRKRQEELASFRALRRIRPTKLVLILPLEFEVWCAEKALVPDESVLDRYAELLAPKDDPDDGWSRLGRPV
jgi:hypothetical protein